MPLIKEEYRENILQIVQQNFDSIGSVEHSIEDVLNKWSKNKEKIYQLFGEQEIISKDVLELYDDEENVQESFSLLFRRLYLFYLNVQSTLKIYFLHPRVLP